MAADINTERRVFFKEGQQDNVLILEEAIGSGATSEVWLGIGSDGRRFAVKIPRTIMFNEEKFISEIDVLTQIGEKQSDPGSQINIPMFYKGYIENNYKDVLILEYISLDNQWMGLSRTSSTFILKGLLEAALQANRLFKLTYQLDILNQDVKIENFYWLESKNRFVFLDWNRCIRGGHSQQSYQAVLDSLVEFIYQSIAGVSSPEPLPPVDQIKSDVWHPKVPRSIKRLLHYRFEKKLTFESIRDELNWQFDILTATLDRPDVELKIQQINADPGTTNREKSEKLLDLKEEILSRDIVGIDYDDALNEIDRLVTLLRTTIPSIASLQKIDMARTLLTRLQPTKANEILLSIVEETPAESLDNKSLFKELFIAYVIKEWFQKFDLALSEEVEKVFRSFDEMIDPRNLLEQSDGLPFVCEHYALYQTSIDLLEETYKINDEVVGLREKQARINQFKDKETAFIRQLPTDTKQLFRNQVPTWDLGAIMRHIHAMESDQAKRHILDEIKEKIRQVLSTSYIYQYSQIEQLLQESTENIFYDQDLSLLKQLHIHLAHENYHNSVRIAELVPTFPNIKDLLINYIIGEIKKFSGRTLYANEIQKLQGFFNLIPDYLMMGDEGLKDLHTRVQFCSEANYESLEDLEQCETYLVEPWAVSDAVKHLCVKNLRGYAQIATMQKNLIERQYEINNLLPKDDLNSLKSIYDSVITQLQALFNEQNVVSEQQVRVKGYCTEMGNLVEELSQKGSELDEVVNRSQEFQSEASLVLAEFSKLREMGVFIPAGLEKAVVVNSWLTTFIMQGSEESLIKAKEICQAYLDQFTPDSATFDILTGWKDDLQRILTSIEKRTTYLAWIGAIKQREGSKSLEYVHRLNHEEGGFLYDFLWNKHISLFSDKEGNEEEYNRLFYSGNLKLLSECLNAITPKSETEAASREAWRAKIKFVRSLQKFYWYDQKELGKLGPIIVDILNEIVPDHYIRLIKISD